MSVVDYNPHFPIKCTRCGASIADMENLNIGHGFEEWCNDCEKSYQEWYISKNQQKQRREKKDENKN